jgi:hypothetical protein
VGATITRNGIVIERRCRREISDVFVNHDRLPIDMYWKLSLLALQGMLVFALRLFGSVHGASSDQQHLSVLPQIGIIHPASRTWRILPRAFRNEVPYVGHQHVAAEPRKQRLFAILPAARAVSQASRTIR